MKTSITLLCTSFCTRFTTFCIASIAFLLLSALTSVNVQGQATVTTDQPDYAPRSNAVFTGSGFAPGENIVLKVKNLSHPCNTIAPDSSYLSWIVAADGNGNFVTNWIVCDCAGDSLRLKATGQTSGLIAYALFSDGELQILAVSPSPFSPNNSATIKDIAVATLKNVGTGTENQSNVRIRQSTIGGTLVYQTPANLNLAGNASTNVNWDGKYNQGINSGNYVPDGIYFVIAYNAKSSGTETTGAGKFQTVIVDNTNPVIVSLPANISQGNDLGLCKAKVTWTEPTVSDANTGATIIQIDGPANGSDFIVGSISTITYKATDAAGNSVTSSFTVTVVDNTKPVITTNGNKSVNNDAGICGAAVTVSATAADNCSVGTPTGVRSDALALNATYPVGVTTITWNVTDINGNAAIAAVQTVTVTDNEAPVAPTLSTVTGECSASVNAPTTNDVCAGTITGTTSDPLTYTTQGTHVIHWTFNDGNGNSTTANQNVIVDDVTPPVTPTLADVTGECSATAGTATTTDVCAGTITGTTSDPLTYTTQGTHVIHWTFNDGNGNSTTANQNVIVDDVTPPVTPTLADVTGECSATAGTATTTDVCAGTITGTTSDPLTYTTQGTHVIHWTFNDGNGNSTTANQNVIVDDVTPPVTPTLADVTGECSATAGTATTTDVCAGTITGTTSDPLTYTTQGTHVIHWTFNDGNGNSTTANQNVIVDDVTPPVTPTLADVTGECSATAGTATTTDVCAGTITGTTSDPLTYTTQGTHVIHWTFNDGNGNSTTANQNVIVDDVTPPVTPTLADVTGECSATAGTATTTDVCAGTITGTTSDPLTYTTQGTHIIHWTFNDGNGNSTTANQNVIVDDVTPPVTPTLADVTGECSATAGTATTTDVCAGTITGTTSDPLTYTTQGTHVIHWTFNDGNGNSTTANQNVIVDDVTPPVTPTLADVTGECSATAGTATTTDVCAGTITGTTSDPLTYTTQGTHVIHWTFNDGNGNSTTANQNVIVDDVTPPVTPTLADVTGECSATAGTTTTTDVCAGTITGTTSDPLTYTTQGTHVIHWTFNDGNGNSTTANQNVIVDDVTPPVTPTLADVTGECSATAGTATTTDVCAGTITGTTSDPLTYTTQGTHVIHWTFNDGNGNSTTANQNVIVDDVTPPVTPTLADVTGECSATAGTATTTDVCAGTITGTTSDPLTYTTQGTHVIHWTFNDGNGNSTTANQNVIVDDVTPPVTPTLADVTGECSATAGTATTTDVCAGTITGTTSDPLTYTTQGTHVIHWTFNDGNGNSTTANQNVIVDDVTPPVAPTLATVTGQCSASVTAPSAPDNCVGSVTGTTGDPLTYNAQGTYTVHWSFNDGSGNISTANQTVIVKDVTAPSITCPADIILTACNGIATWSTPSFSDNCSGATIAQTGGPASGYEFANGTTTTISYTVTDVGGNQTSCSFKVIRPAALDVLITNNNQHLYFGYSGDQTDTIRVKPSGGSGTYNVTITMNRKLLCNVVNSTGNEVWKAATGGNSTSSNATCPVSGSLAPVSTKTITSGQEFYVIVTLMDTASISITVTDAIATACNYSTTTPVYASDVRCFAGNSGIAKITVCHRTGSAKNPCVTICVDPSALQEHLDHGDFVGSCTKDCTAPNTLPAVTTTIALSPDAPATALDVKVINNPSMSNMPFKLQLISNNGMDGIQMKVTDVTGKPVELKSNLFAGQTIEIGRSYVAGMYFVQVLQGNQRKMVKLVKQ